MSSPSNSAPPSKGQVAAVVSFYMAAALIMVFVNKAVLNAAPEMPLLFLLMQLIIAVILLHAAALALPTRVDLPTRRSFTWDATKKLTPVVLVNAFGLVFNTLCLRAVEPSFFQIARGLVLPLTIVVSAIHLRLRPSSAVLTAAGFVTFGFLIGVAPNKDLPASATPSLLALFYGLLSSLFIAVHAVLIKSSLPHVGGSSIQLAYWSNLGGAVILLPIALISGELEAAWKDAMLGSSAVRDWSIFLTGSAITGTFGFLLCIASLISIKVTSPVTHMFSSAARSVVQTMLGVWIFHDVLTLARGASILTILAGTMYYTWVKSTETPANAGPRAVPEKAQDLERGPAARDELQTLMEEEEEDDEGLESQSLAWRGPPKYVSDKPQA